MLFLFVSLTGLADHRALRAGDDSPAAPAASPAAAAPAPELLDSTRVGSGPPVRLAIHPSRFELRGRDRALQLVVSGVDAGGGVADVTGEARLESSDPGVLRVEADGSAVPVADGSAKVIAVIGSARAEADVTVAGAAIDLPINFANDIVPIFSKHGCNAGGCHGKSGGQNGFQLSLFGFTPSVDYGALVRESRARRVFPAAPEHSLLLRKATGLLPHGGGERFRSDSPDYRLLYRWQRAGLPLGKPDDPVVERIEVFPRHRTLSRGKRQQLQVTAYYTGGRAEDVTRRARFESGEEGYLKVDPSGLVTVLDLPGQGTVLVRYQGHVGLFRATIPYGADLSAHRRPASDSYIDRLAFARLDLLQIPSSDVCTDGEFLRRASLDLCGATPAADEAARFLADTDPDKRRKLIDRLLERPEYASYFSLLWADLLRNRRGGEQRAAPQTIAFHRWVYESFAANKPFDRFVRELLCAEGNVADNPVVAWYRDLENPKELVDDTAQVFLGTRMQCARCHHHPFEKWGQEDYWSFANFFSRLSRKNESNSRRFTITMKRGTSRISDDEPTSASYRKSYEGLKLPGGARLADVADEDPRERLVDWMVAPENGLFARGVVNRYWKHLFGRGIVEPEDDLRETNPPSNPDLLDALAADFAKSSYDVKKLIRTICNSATYQMSSTPSGHNARDRQSFSRYQVRRLPAEVLLDAVDRVTAAKTRFSGVLREMRAIDLPDEASRNYFLEVFGKPDRSSACSCERSSDITLPQVLHLLNSREVQEKLSSGEGRAALLARDPRPDSDRVEELFLWVYSRKPALEETREALAHLSGASEVKEPEAKGPEAKGEAGRRKAWEDLLWALLNTKEFVFER